MTQTFETRLQEIDRTLLTPLVRRMLQQETISVVDWIYEPVSGGFSQATGHSHGIYRFRGTVRMQDTSTNSWSLILKATQRPSALEQEVPTHSEYWKREAFAYQSGLLDALPGGIRAPHCFGVVEYPPSEWWIWLEDIPVTTDTAWQFDDYGVAARHLGQFNGAYFVGHPLPIYPWLSTGRVRDWLAWTEPVIPDLRTLSHHPLARRWLNDENVERILSLWADRESLLAARERLPRCLCHHDAFRRNLILHAPRSSRDQTIAIDWAFVGTGVIGEELVPLVTISLDFLEVAMSQAKELDAAVFAGYLGGLADAGWQGDARQVRLGYTATAALFMGLGAVGPWLSSILADEGQGFANVVGYPIEHILDQYALLQGYLLDLGDEARELITQGW